MPNYYNRNGYNSGGDNISGVSRSRRNYYDGVNHYEGQSIQNKKNAIKENKDYWSRVRMKRILNRRNDVIRTPVKNQRQADLLQNKLDCYERLVNRLVNRTKRALDQNNNKALGFLNRFRLSKYGLNQVKGGAKYDNASMNLFERLLPFYGVNKERAGRLHRKIQLATASAGYAHSKYTGGLGIRLMKNTNQVIANKIWKAALQEANQIDENFRTKTKTSLKIFGNKKINRQGPRVNLSTYRRTYRCSK